MFPRKRESTTANVLCCTLAVFVLISTSVCSEQLNAATYYVRTDGNDSNSGTGSDAANAWATVVGASTKSLSAGDVVYVQAGTYLGTVAPTVDGTSGSPITFISDRAGSVSGWSAGDVIIQAPVGEHALHVSFDSYLTFSGFLFEGDSGRDTVDIDNGSGTVLQQCEIYDGFIGVDIDDADATIVNCLVRDNVSDGIALDVGTVAVMNSTVVNNVNDGVFIAAGTLTVTNCIIANNNGDGFDVNGGTLIHTYNLVHGSGSNNYEATSASTGEITADPQFVGGSDYRVRTISPAVDSGSDMAGTVDDDIDGLARPYDTGWDMGCYEMAPDGHWKLDDSVAKQAADSSGNGYHGEYSGSPTVGTSAKYGTAVDFSGASDLANLPTIDLDTSSGVSVSLWIKPRTAQTGFASFFSLSNGSNQDDIWIGWDDNEGAEIFLSDTVEGSSFIALVDSTLLTIGAWQHYVMTIDNAGNAKIYRNGTLSASGSIGTPKNVARTVNMIAKSDWGYPFDGELDEIRLYSYALNSSEVVTLFDGLVGHWKLDETSGTVAADSSSQANDGTYTSGPTLGASGAYPGIVLNSVEFDGIDDHVDLPGMNLDFSNGFSIALWVKPAATLGAGEFYAFLDLSNGSNVDEIWLGMVGGAVGFQLYLTDTDDGSPLKTIEDNKSFEKDEWVHCVATVDASGDAILYRNGQVTKSGFYTSIPTNVLRAQATLATSPLNDNFPGALDDVRLYNRSLTASEVSELYGLVGHWNMDEGAGATAADSTGYGNDATLNGATWTTDCAGNHGLEFDGVGDTATTNSSFDPPDVGAIAVWLRSAGNPGARSRPFGVGGDWEMRQESDGTLSFDLGGEGPDEGAGGDEFITTAGLSFEDRWYHVVAQFDATDDSFEVYINGELTDSGTNGDDMVKQLADTLTFGTRTGNTEYWEGALRDFRVYNRWLGNSEISELSGLAGYWKLDETSGTVAVDSSPIGNDGTYTNGVLINQIGTVDQAADFDGTDDYVGVVDDTTLQMDSTFSMSMWIRADDSTNVDRMILNKEGEYEIALSSSGELKWGITNTDPGWSWHSTGYFVSIGKWTHLALTYDNGTVSTYANGVLVDTYSGSGDVGDQYTSLNELRIGGRSNNPTGKYFDGRIDDVRVFSRVMCPEEVFGQYKGGRPSGIRILKWIEVR